MISVGVPFIVTIRDDARAFVVRIACAHCGAEHEVRWQDGAGMTSHALAIVWLAGHVKDHHTALVVEVDA